MRRYHKQEKIGALKYMLLVVVALFAALDVANAQQVRRETLKYHEELYLDRYWSDEPAVAGQESPAMIFMFGGGFYTGVRDRKEYLPYFHFLASRGIQVFSIDYRLGLAPLVEKMKGAASGEEEAHSAGPVDGVKGGKGRKSGKIAAARQMVGLLRKSIDMAVEDLFRATAFIISNAEKWGIDTSMIMTSGSSAGAISVLEAEYALCNGGEEVEPYNYVPLGFKYAGVVSFAGAIMSVNGKFVYKVTIDTMADARKLVDIATKIKDKVLLQSGEKFRVNAKSFLGVVLAKKLNYNDLKLVMDEDHYHEFQQFIEE